MGAPRVSDRARHLAAFEVMDIVRAARERDEAVGEDTSLRTCHLEVGQPSAPTPGAVIEAAHAALAGPLGYTEAIGAPELRARIAAFHRQRHRSDLTAERVVVTSGASAGCVLTVAAVTDPGDLVAVCEPGYPCYRNIAESLGAEVVGLEVDATSGYRPTPELLQRILGTRPVAAVVVASPSNPTGTVLDRGQLDGLHRWCSDHGAILVVDEIYHGTAEATLPSAADLDDAIVVQSFSKYFCMTGWRLGWLVVPDALVRPIERLAQNLYLSPNALSQHAALAAFETTDELDGHAARYRRNRELLISALRGVGVRDIAPAEGAFYVWADLGDWGAASSLCATWLSELGVACTPGGDFDTRRGSTFVRFSVAGDTSEIEEAADRLSAWLSARSTGTSR